MLIISQNFKYSIAFSYFLKSLVQVFLTKSAGKTDSESKATIIIWLKLRGVHLKMLPPKYIIDICTTRTKIIIITKVLFLESPENTKNESVREIKLTEIPVKIKRAKNAVIKGTESL